jgi:hypothetical protein
MHFINHWVSFFATNSGRPLVHYLRNAVSQIPDFIINNLKRDDSCRYRIRPRAHSSSIQLLGDKDGRIASMIASLYTHTDTEYNIFSKRDEISFGSAHAFALV